MSKSSHITINLTPEELKKIIRQEVDFRLHQLIEHQSQKGTARAKYFLRRIAEIERAAWLKRLK